MHIYTAIKEKVMSYCNEQNKYIFKRDINDDSDEAHLTSFGTHFQKEEEAKENDRSPMSPYCVQVFFLLKDTTDFLCKLNDITRLVTPDSLFATMDVNSSHTNIPHSD